jgi:hypothetical protein
MKSFKDIVNDEPINEANNIAKFEKVRAKFEAFRDALLLFPITAMKNKKPMMKIDSKFLLPMRKKLDDIENEIE